MHNIPINSTYLFFFDILIFKKQKNLIFPISLYALLIDYSHVFFFIKILFVLGTFLVYVFFPVLNIRFTINIRCTFTDFVKILKTYHECSTPQVVNLNENDTIISISANIFLKLAANTIN